MLRRIGKEEGWILAKAEQVSSWEQADSSATDLDRPGRLSEDGLWEGARTEDDASHSNAVGAGQERRARVI